MLVLVVGIAVGALILFLLFGLKFTRILANNQEQKTSIEAAALAAAKDLSRIVIEDPYFGFVSLSDYAPIGTNTAAQDNFYMPVEGINTLLGTVRLDMIIADYMQDPIMQQCAANDYQHALQAQKSLTAALQSAVLPGGTGTDIDGNVVSPQQDAIQAYNQNLERLTGGQSSLVAGSLKLQLGYLPNLPSNITIPQPPSVASVSANQQQNGFYLACMDIPCDGNSFVFAALGSDVTLVDAAQFSKTLTGLPYSTPSVVKCDADEFYADRSITNGVATRTVHDVAAAEIGVLKDARPAPGAFTITFLDSLIPEIASFGSLFNQSQIALSPSDVLQTPLTGDYPQTPLSNMVITNLPVSDPYHPPFGQALSIAFYDWIRRAGTTVNVQSLITTLNTPLLTGRAGPQIHQFEATPQGDIAYSVYAAPQEDLSVSQKQWRAISGLAFTSQSNGMSYDLQITDFVNQPGRINGGKHGGEPLPFNGPVQPYPPSSSAFIPSYYENVSWSYLTFPTAPPGGAVRTTYKTTGMAVDFTFRPHP